MLILLYVFVSKFKFVAASFLKETLRTSLTMVVVVVVVVVVVFSK